MGFGLGSWEGEGSLCSLSLLPLFPGFWNSMRLRKGYWIRVSSEIVKRKREREREREKGEE